MASIERNGRGWRAVYRTGGRDSKREKSATFARKGDAIAAAKRIESDLAAKKNMSLGQILSWDELIKRYKIQLSNNQHSPDYADKVEKSLLNLISQRPWKSTADVTPGNVGVLKVSQHRYLKAILRYAQLLNQPVDPRCVRLPLPRRPKAPPADLLTDDEVSALLARAERYCPSLMAAGHLVATYGHRPESLVKITCGDVRLDLAPPNISMDVKSGDRIRHPLTEATVAILKPLVEGRKSKDLLLLRPDGDPWKDGNALALYWYRQVGEFVTPERPGIYHLKRRAISRLLAKGLDPATIASMTGHRTPSVILTYARTNDARQKIALAILEELGENS